MAAMFKCVSIFPWRRQLEWIDKRHCNLTHIPDEIFRHERTLEELNLDANQLHDLPKPLFRLYKLRRLGLSDNEIENIPSEIGNLTSLEELDLSKNDISFLPENIQYCKKLKVLELGSNPLSVLPNSFTSLTAITNLCINDISLAVVPPDIGSLQNLVLLEMRENLVKFLPESFSFLLNLESLDLGCNELEELPESIGQLTNLVEKWLDGNCLTIIPKEIGNLKSLQCLDLSENKLEELPDEISGLLALTDLHLSQNDLHELPDGIGKLKKLSVLKVEQNQLDELTPAIGGAINLTELILTENELDGLPIAIGKLHKLTLLNVDRNRLTSLPPEIGSCTRLAVLSARENEISKLPRQIGNCRSLTVLDLSGNKLPNLPLTISQLPLKALWLSSNQSQSILKLQVEDDEENDDKVLTCFLLPQAPQRTPSLENFIEDMGIDNATGKSWSSFPKVQFCGTEEDDEDRVTDFERRNTPYPKDLKAKHPNRVLHKQRSSSIESDQKEDHKEPHVADKKPVGVRMQEAVVIIENREPNDMFEEEEEEHLNDDENGEDDEDDDYEEKHVGFHMDPGIEPVEHDDDEFRLKRKDTPHFTKGKRIVLDDEEKALEILANLKSKGEVNGEGDGIALVENEQKASAVKFAFQNDVSDHIDDEVEVFDDFDENLLEMERKEKAFTRLTRKGTPRPKDLMAHGPPQIRISPEIVAEEDESLLERSGENVSFEQRTITKVYEEITTTLVREGFNLGINIAGGKGTTPYKEDEEGVFISKISDDGPAARAGILHVGDKITKVNDDDIADANHHHAVLALKNAGSEVTITVLREITDEDSIQKALEMQREEKNVRFAPEPEMEEIEVATETLAVVLKRDHRGLGFSIAGGRGSTPFKGSDPGVFISKVAENGPAGMDGRLRVGDKVMTINGKDVSLSSHEDAVGVLTSAGDRVSMLIYRERIINKRMTPVSKLNGSAGDTFPGKYPIEETTQPFQNHIGGSELYGDDIHDKKLLTEEVILKKGIGPLGLSIVGGLDHASHPFGVDEPGIFVSKIVPHGVAFKTNLQVGDRVLAVNDINMRNSTHHEAVAALISNVPQIKLLVRHDPPPTGMQEIDIIKAPGEKLGISIRGGAKGHPGNPFDKSDEGVFVSKVTSGGAAARDARLKVGMRILEVNGTSTLGATHVEAVRSLRNTGDRLKILVCDGYDERAPNNPSQSNIIANPLATMDMSKELHAESISSIDREQSPDEDGPADKWNTDHIQQIEALRNARTQDTKVLEDELETKEKELLEKSERAERLAANTQNRVEEADKRLKGRVQQQNECSNATETDIDSERKGSTEIKRQPSASETRAIEAEKRAAWRQARMKALEEDAIKAQVVIAQVKALSSSSLEGSNISDGERADNSMFS